MTTSTKIEIGYGRINRLAGASDLAELLFPGSRGHQHAFLVIWFTLKWADPQIVPNLTEAARDHGISRRTFERVRSKMRRLGLIERVSRFSPRLAGREGWVPSSRFERGLEQLALKTAGFRDARAGSKEKDRLLVRLADARRVCLPVKREESGTNAPGSPVTASMDREVSKSQGL